jgi:cysteinyl-tRNA synthetase
MLRIYNTLTKEKEVFKPIVPNQIGFYICGITVYDFSHLGHARAYLAFDMVLRYLRESGYKVWYVRNITDVDDKIIKRSQENNESWQDLTERFIKAMSEDFAMLNMLPPDLEPRATEYIPEMVALIQRLMDKGYAYTAPNGDVYYDVEKFESYGCLSHRNIDDLKSGARIEVNEHKQNPLDFVLWKMAKPGEPFWPSPWGNGRPGWHIECSAMSLKTLGETFDIHGGGPDLKFPHHENERAQSEAANDKKFVNTWMHIGYLQINKEKMSKSLGNFLTIRDFLKNYHSEILRYFSIISHYRSPVDYAPDNINSAIAGMERLYTALRGLPDGTPPEKTEFEAQFRQAMDDDFNTPIAFSVLFELAREINRTRDTNPSLSADLGALLKKLGNLLGLLYSTPDAFLQGIVTTGLDTDLVEERIKQRNEARAAKNWALADQIRDELLNHGIALDDTSQGTIWRRESAH